MRWSRSFVVMGAVAALFAGCAAAPKDAAPAGQATARERVAQGAFLLDVRTPEEFAEGHLPGAELIPVQSLAARLGEVPKDRPVVVYCRSGKRSAQAAAILRDAGRTDVIDLGAMSNW